MQTLSLAEVQSRAFLPQQPNSSVLVQNIGGLNYRHPSVYACQAPAAATSGHSPHTVQYLSHGGQTANRIYWNGPAANVNYFPVSLSSPVVQGNASATVERKHQLPPGTAVARNASVSYAPQSCIVRNALYGEQQAPMRAGYFAASDVTLQSDRANAQRVQGSGPNQNDYVSREAGCFSRPCNAPQPPVSQAHGNWSLDQSKLEMLLRMEMGFHPPVQFPRPRTRDANPRGVANAERDARNDEHETVRAVPRRQNAKARREAASSDQELGNGASVSRLVPTSDQRCSSWVQADRNGGLQRTVDRGREPAVSLPNSATPAGPSSRPHLQETRPVDQGGVNQNASFLWSDKHLESIFRTLLESSEPLKQGKGDGGGTARNSVAETRLDPAGPSVRAPYTTRQQPHPNIPSLGAAGLPRQNPPCLPQQGNPLSTSSLPPLPQIPQGPVEKSYPQGGTNQIPNFTNPPPYPGSRNGHANESGRLAGAVRVVHHTSNQLQPRVSGTEYDLSTIPYYSHQPSVGTSNPPIQAKQLREQLYRGQTVGNSTPQSVRGRLSVTAPVGEVSKALTGSQPANCASALHNGRQMSSVSKSAKVDYRTASGGVCGNEGPQNHSAPLLTIVAQSQESVFKPPKVSNQQNNSSACSSQKAVAVVPPLSPQSSNHVDQEGGITNANNDVPFKINTVMSPSGEEVMAGKQFALKMADVVPLSSQADVRMDEKVSRFIGSGTPIAGGLTATYTESTVPCQERASEMSGSTGLAMPPTPGASVIKEIDKRTSNQQKFNPLPQDILRPPPAEDVPGSAVQCQAPSPTDIHKKDDQDVDSEKVAFDLPSVAVKEWTSEAVGNLITLCEKSSEPIRQEMDIKETARLYGGWEYHNLPDIFGSDLYKSIMDEVRGVCGEDENAVIFSEIDHTCLRRVTANCHILKHELISPHEPTAKPLVLNATAQRRLSPRVKQLTVRKQLEGARLNGAEKDKIDKIAGAKQEGNAPLLDTPSLVEKAESTEESGAMDTFSSIKISVLPHEEARWFFYGERSGARKEEEPQSEPPAGESARKEESQVEEERTETQVKVYHCHFCWIGATIGFKGSFCTCLPEAEPGGAMEKEERGDRSVSGQEEKKSTGRSSAVEPNAALVHTAETSKEELPVGKETIDECTESKSAVDTTRDASDSTEQEDAGLCAEQEDGRVDLPASSSVENLADIDPLSLSDVSPASDAPGTESDEADSESNAATAVVLEQLLKESFSKGGPQQTPQGLHAEEIPATESKAECFVTPGCTGAISEIRTTSPLAELWDLYNLERKIGSMTSLSLRQRFHRRLSSKEMHSRTQGDVRAREGKHRSRRWQKSSCSKSPDRDPSPQNPPQSQGSKRRKDRLSSLPSSATKATVLDHHNGEESPCSKSPDRDPSPQNPPQSQGSKRRKDRLSSLPISATKATVLDHHNGEESPCSKSPDQDPSPQNPLQSQGSKLRKDRLSSLPISATKATVLDHHNGEESPCSKSPDQDPSPQNPLQSQGSKLRKDRLSSLPISATKATVLDHHNGEESPCSKSPDQDLSPQNPPQSQGSKRRKDRLSSLPISATKATVLDHDNGEESPCSKSPDQDSSPQNPPQSQGSKRRKDRLSSLPISATKATVLDHQNGEESPCSKSPDQDPSPQNPPQSQGSKRRKDRLSSLPISATKATVLDHHNGEESPCSKSPDQDPSPQNPPQSQGSKLRKDCLSSLPISATKVTVLIHHNGEKSLPVKREADLCFVAPKSKIPKLGEDECLRLFQGSKAEHGHTLNQGTSSRELPELKKKIKRVCFTLYGSSSENGNGTTNSNRKLGRKTPVPPAALDLSVNCKEASVLRKSIKSPAKQQVFNDWERSFVPLKSRRRSEARACKQSDAKGLESQKCGTRREAGTPVSSPISCGSRSKPSRARTKPLASAQSTAGLRACTTHLDKINENKCSDSKAGITSLNKTKEKKKQSAPKAVLHPNKNQEKRNSAPKAGTKHLNEREEKRNTAAKSAEKKFVSKFFQRQAKDSPSISRETRQQKMEKALLPVEGAETVPGKRNQGKTKRSKKEELEYKMRSMLPASGLCEMRVKYAAGVGNAHQMVAKKKDSTLGLRLQSGSPPLKGAPCCMETKKSARHGKGSSSKTLVEKDCYKATSCSKATVSISARISFQDDKRRHMENNKK